MTRSIDHVVLPVNSLADATETLRALGFTVTPRARHPWGTANCLVQFDGVFLEYLEVADESDFPQSLGANAFSFAHFNRDWLNRLGEGASMLVLTGTDAAGDRAAFEKAGLRVYDAFDFERTATLPDGDTRKVAFSLTFIGDPGLPDIGFFTCQHHFPENFWKPDYQRHENTAADLAGVVIVADAPARHTAFLAAFAGQDAARPTRFGFEIAAGRHTISILTPAGYEALYGASTHRLVPGSATIAAIRIRVKDETAVAACLKKAGIAAERRGGGRIIDAKDCHGCAMVFEHS